MTTPDDREAHRRFTAGYFTSVSVAGVRCFGPEQKLELMDGDRPAKWTIILGENGVGKTTLLQCLWAMAPEIDQPRAGALASSHPRGLVSDRLTGLGRNEEIALRIQASLELGATFAASTRGPTAPNVVVMSSSEADVQAAEIVISTMRFPEPGPAPAPKIPFAHQGANNYPAGANLLLCGYGALRRSTSFDDPLEAGQVRDSSATLFSDSASLISGSEWFLREDYAASATGEVRASVRRDKVRDAIINLLPDVSDIRVAGLSEQPPRPRIDVLTHYGWVPMSTLSLGYRSMISWVVEFASRMFAAYPGSADPLAEAAIALVDEIDLHLHPAWQRQITAHLDRLFPNVQFIATAHSPLIVQAEGVTNVAVLRRVGDHVEILNDPEQVHGWRVDQILTSDLFGLSSARPIEVERLLARQQELVLVDRPTNEQRAELAAVDAKLADLAPGETAKDRETWAIVRRLADKLTATGR